MAAASPAAAPAAGFDALTNMADVLRSSTTLWRDASEFDAVYQALIQLGCVSTIGFLDNFCYGDFNRLEFRGGSLVGAPDSLLKDAFDALQSKCSALTDQRRLGAIMLSFANFCRSNAQEMRAHLLSGAATAVLPPLPGSAGASPAASAAGTPVGTSLLWRET